MWFSEVFVLSLKTKPTPQAMNLLNLLNQTTPHSVHFTHAAEHPMHSEFNPESFRVSNTNRNPEAHSVFTL